MNRQCGSDRPLRSVFQCNGCSKKRHNTVTGHLIDRALIVVNLVNEDLVDLVHDGVSLFRAESLHKRRKALHVAEHHCDLLAFAFYLVSLAQDFLCQALGKITLNFVYLLIKRQVFGGWLSGDS